MMDDDDDWQEMPVVRERSPSMSTSTSSDEGGSIKKGKKGKRMDTKWSATKSYQRSDLSPTLPIRSRGVTSTTNATGTHLDIDDARGYRWRAKPTGLGEAGGITEETKEEKKRKKEEEKKLRAKGKNKGKQSESSGTSSESDEDDDEGGARGYTQLRPDDDPEVEQISAASDYLFKGGHSTAAIEDGDVPAATPYSQLNTTKNLLSEGQKIAYVGLVSLVAKRMIRILQRVPGKELQAAITSTEEWRLRVMARLFQHMEIEIGEQTMIESLAEHGVLPEDLSPSLITTQTVDNPDFDPEAEREREEEQERQEEIERQEMGDLGIALDEGSRENPTIKEVDNVTSSIVREDEDGDISGMSDDGGDLGSMLDGESDSGDISSAAVSPQIPPLDYSKEDLTKSPTPPTKYAEEDEGDITAALGSTPRTNNDIKLADAHTANQIEMKEEIRTTPMGLTNEPQTIDTLPSALEGVTTELSSADKTITLDLRWTVLCDLFLVLTADSVYDARSRALLETVAEELGLHWMDVTKFEKRVTDALEIEEGVSGSLKGKRAVRKRAEAARRRRMVMMGLATVGGGLVIGLSAGLMAPLIGAGLGAALGTIGIGGTTGFLGGVGGAAIITTTGTVSGAALGGTGMNKRTRQVKVFEFKPIHNNKRVNCIIAVPGFMSGPLDDPRLPFSIVDSIMGDVFSLLWEPDMMQDMGNAIYILWNETLVQGVQQLLAATIAGGLVGALAWPLWLTKLGYFIDNPWSNALDRAYSCGLILADVLIKRKMGVRPISLVGFSLGARVIFYALVELARQKKYGIVQNVYLMGAPVTANVKTWKEARGAVAGRFVNAFSRTDWILGYLFRATSGGLHSIAGLRPVEKVPEIENVDVTQIVPGHLQYRAYVPLVLDQLGFKTTADYFDEPEDLNAIPEREIRYDEEVGENGQSRPKGFAGLWNARKKQSIEKKNEAGENSEPSSATKSSFEYDEDVDLPPREASGLKAQPEIPIITEQDEVDRSLEELRQNGVEVKEIEGSLSTLCVDTPRKTERSSLEVPSPARPKFPLPSDRSFSNTRSASSTSSRRDSAGSVLSAQGSIESHQSKKSSSYARRFGSTAFDVDELPPPAVRATEANEVSLSFPDSYEDEGENTSDQNQVVKLNQKDREILDKHAASAKQYGLSNDTAKELAKQFHSSGMSSEGASAAAKLAQDLSEGGSNNSSRASLEVDPWMNKSSNHLFVPSPPTQTLSLGRVKSEEDYMNKLKSNATTPKAGSNLNENPWD